jgi:hypothetical protein
MQTWVLISSKELQIETFSQAMVKGVFLGLGMAIILCGNLKFNPTTTKKGQKLSY